eukprot:764593-Rhodomonas_salina.1
MPRPPAHLRLPLPVQGLGAQPEPRPRGHSQLLRTPSTASLSPLPSLSPRPTLPRCSNSDRALPLRVKSHRVCC